MICKVIGGMRNLLLKMSSLSLSSWSVLQGGCGSCRWRNRCRTIYNFSIFNQIICKIVLYTLTEHTCLQGEIYWWFYRLSFMLVLVDLRMLTWEIDFPFIKLVSQWYNFYFFMGTLFRFSTDDASCYLSKTYPPLPQLVSTPICSCPHNWCYNIQSFPTRYEKCYGFETPTEHVCWR